MSYLPVYVTDPDTFEHLGENQFILEKVVVVVWDKKRGTLLPMNPKCDEFLHMEDAEQLIRAIRDSYKKVDSSDLREMAQEYSAECEKERAARQAKTEQKPNEAKRLSVSEVGILPDQSIDTSGNIYLLANTRGECKIGKAKELHKRINAISLQLPFKVSLVHSFPAKNYHRAERALHQKFASKRTNGEWFVLDRDDIAWIKAISKM